MMPLQIPFTVASTHHSRPGGIWVLWTKMMDTSRTLYQQGKPLVNPHPVSSFCPMVLNYGRLMSRRYDTCTVLYCLSTVRNTNTLA